MFAQCLLCTNLSHILSFIHVFIIAKKLENKINSLSDDLVCGIVGYFYSSCSKTPRIKYPMILLTKSFNNIYLGFRNVFHKFLMSLL